MRVLLAWGGGIGSLLALDALTREAHEVDLLAVSTARESNAARALPDFVVEEQAAALGRKLHLARAEGRDEATALEETLRASKPDRVAFGYVRNEAHMTWRLARMQRETGVEGLLPVRHLPPGEAALRFVESGHRAFVRAALDPAPGSWLGRFLDAELVDEVDGLLGPGGWGCVRFLAVDGPRFARRVDAMAGEPVPVEGGVRLDVGLRGC